MGASVSAAEGEAPGEPPKLTPEMSSRKLQALAIIKKYFFQWGYSPTLDEIAASLGVSRKRAHELVGKLAEEEMIHHEAGKTRGIRLVDKGQEMTETDVLLRLASLGWKIVRGAYVIEAVPPSADGSEAAGAILRGVTEKGLHTLPVLDHKPPRGDELEGTSGQTETKRRRGRAAAHARESSVSESGEMGAQAS